MGVHSMNFTIDTTDLERARRSFEQFSDRRFAAGMATALTLTGKAVQDAQQREMQDVFDRPTRWTLGAVYVRPASATRLEAIVGIMDNPFGGRPPIKWLHWQIRGGLRTPTALERRLMSAGAMPDDMRMVPGRFARLDAFGNISTGQIRQILSQLRIELSSGAKSTLPRVSGADRRLIARARRSSGFVGPLSGTAVKNARAKVNRVDAAYRRAGGQYIALPYGRGKLRPGVYQVRDFGGAGRADPRPVLIFVSRAQYEAGRYDFDYVSELAIRRNLPAQVDAAMADQLRRWASKYQGAA
jgi:hypothetical protein